MSVAYKIVPKKQSAAGEVAWHSVIVNQGIVGKRELAQRIAARSILGAPEVMAVLEALIETIPELMREGKILKLEGLGSFQLYARSQGASSPDAFDEQLMKRPRLHFQPSQLIRQELELIEWERKE